MHSPFLIIACLIYLLALILEVGHFSVLHRVYNSLLSHFNDFKFPCLESTTFIFSKGLVGNSTLLYYRSFQNCIYIYLNGYDVLIVIMDLIFTTIIYYMQGFVIMYVAHIKTHFLDSLMAKQSCNDCHEFSTCTISVKNTKTNLTFLCL